VPCEENDSRTRNDSQLASQIRQANFGYVDAIYLYGAAGGFHEPEECEGQSTEAL
jgi:hypothetical protein